MGQRSPPGHSQLLPSPVFPAAGSRGALLGLAGGALAAPPPSRAQRGAGRAPERCFTPAQRCRVPALALSPAMPTPAFPQCHLAATSRGWDTPPWPELLELLLPSARPQHPGDEGALQWLHPQRCQGCLRALSGARDTRAVPGSRVTLPGSFSGHIRRCRSRELSRELISVA